MKFTIDKNQIEIFISLAPIVLDNIEMPQSKSWVFTKDSFKKQSCDFEPLPQNVIEWVNS